MNDENFKDEFKAKVPQEPLGKPSNAFIAASWSALIIGISAYLIGLFNAEMELNEKGYYFTVLLFGLFAVIRLEIIKNNCLTIAGDS